MKKNILVIFAFFVSVMAASAQFPIDTTNRFNPSINLQDSLDRIVSESFFGDSDKPPKADTVQVRYHFVPKDTLIYNVLGLDSIIFENQPAFRKTRVEELRIICDSIGENGHYYLTIYYPVMRSFLFAGNEQGVESDENPWLGRKVFIEIDSLGKKHSFYYDNPEKFALNSGSAFQQNLIPDLGESIKAIGESWLLKSTEEIPENGAPPPLVNYTSLFRMKARLDTLGYKCIVYEFIKAGQGSFILRSMNTASYFNEWNRVIIGQDVQVPIFANGTMEQKLSVKAGKRPEEKGKHFINLTYKLVEIKKATNPGNKKSKTKKSKKRK